MGVFSELDAMLQQLDDLERKLNELHKLSKFEPLNIFKQEDTEITKEIEYDKQSE